uniref:Phosphoinositide phospholipase C n=1 Tax=Denticeps clupeoides TaxID=299321 RepID=A0AAY4C1D0_9TELE
MSKLLIKLFVCGCFKTHTNAAVCRISGLGIQSDDNLQRMMVGSMMRKVKSRTWKKQRHFRLQEDGLTVGYKSSICAGKVQIKVFFTVSLCDVEAVREGHQSEILLSIADEFPPDRCFTLVFRGRRGNLDLVAETAAEAQAWIHGIRTLLENIENMGESEKLDQWICDWFHKGDKNKDGRMNFKEVRKLLKMMNMDMNEEHALLLFTTADKSQTDSLNNEEFVQFYKMLTEREEVVGLFQEYSSDGEKLSVCDLEDFLREEQLESENSQQRASELIDRYEPSDGAKTLPAMSIDGFLMYLCSSEGSIFNLEHKGIYQDMTLPLCHYFICSSHNTYLLEDQLRGQSSVEGYIQALKRGCRCVEVDCWDGANGEPVVYHGHTLTSKILFKDVVATVGNYAFKVSEHPVILSLENHCGIDQQRVMAMHLSSILGDKLLKAPLNGRTPYDLPSPEVWLVIQSLCAELSDLVVYCKSVHFRSFEHSRIHSKPIEVSSFSEFKARKYLKEAGTEFVRHNARQLTRVYPTGMRTDSSNFCPQEMWNIGCQIVALNVQTAGMEMDLNDGFFRQNGSCGYILKPDFLRKPESNFDPERPQDFEGYHPQRLLIRVISGQQLPKLSKKEGSIVDPLVKVEIYGVPQDQAKQETRHIDNNGFNPIWNETLEFAIHTPDLAIVRFVVEDYDKASRNDFVGQYALPFKSIQPGYRHIHLLSKDGTSIPPSSLFVHIGITEAS